MNNTKKLPIWTPNFISLMVCTLCLFIIFFGLMNLLPIYVVNELDGTTAQAGATITAFLLSSLIMRPFSGKLMDIYGKKNVLVFGCVLYLISTFLYVIIDDFILLIILRFFHGLWFSLTTTVTGAIAADITPKSRRAEGLGYFMLTMNIGMVIGPFIALTFVNELSYYAIYLIFGVIILIGFISSLFIRVTTLKLETRNLKIKVSDLFESKAVPISVFACCIALAFSSIAAFISIFATELELIKPASFFFLLFAAAVILSRPIVGPLFDEKGPNIVIIPAIFLFALGLYTLSITTNAALLLTSAFFIGLGFGTLLPCLQTMAISSAQAERSGHATATFFALYDIGVASGSYIWGIVVSYSGYSNMYLFLCLFVLVLLLPYRMIQKRFYRVREQG